MRRARAALAAIACAVALAGLAAGCQTAAPDPGPSEPARQVRVGYFATVTHAPALVGIARGTFAEHLGDTVLTTQVFSAGPAALEALNAGAIDAAFLGPNPAITGFVMSDGEGLRIVSGAASGGAQLVVQPGVTSPQDLRGAVVASPQLGGTQDVALRTWLAEQGLHARLRGGGDVSITPTANALALQLFRDGELDGVWAPEPWASRLVVEAGGVVLVDERELWPQGRFPTTYLVVSAAYLERHEPTVSALVAATVDAVAWLESNPVQAADLVNERLEELTGQRLQPPVLERAMANVTFGVDPLAATLEQLHQDAVRAETAPEASLSGILDLSILNAVRAARGEAPVPDAGLGHGQGREPGGGDGSGDGG